VEVLVGQLQLGVLEDLDSLHQHLAVFGGLKFFGNVGFDHEVITQTL
jgi:hypothetical protein